MGFERSDSFTYVLGALGTALRLLGLASSPSSERWIPFSLLRSWPCLRSFITIFVFSKGIVLSGFLACVPCEQVSRNSQTYLQQSLSLITSASFLQQQTVYRGSWIQPCLPFSAYQFFRFIFSFQIQKESTQLNVKLGFSGERKKGWVEGQNDYPPHVHL